MRKFGFVNLRDLGEDFIFEIRYASAHNFSGRPVYPLDVPVLREGTAAKLVQIHRRAKAEGCRIKIFDAYRPMSYHRLLYEAAPDKSFWADPARGSKHSRGAAVDATLTDLLGRELMMPSYFDEFSPRAARKGPWDPGIMENLSLLTDLMTGGGFRTISTEWWHFDDSDWEKYPLADHDLKEFMVTYDLRQH